MRVVSRMTESRQSSLSRASNRHLLPVSTEVQIHGGNCQGRKLVRGSTSWLKESRDAIRYKRRKQENTDNSRQQKVCGLETILKQK